MKIVIHNKNSTFKIIVKLLLLNEVVPPPGSHFWDELAFISINICVATQLDQEIDLD